MKKMTTILSLLLVSSTVFAASSECTRMLGSLLIHTKEGARLNAAAIHHGFNIYTGEIDKIDNQSKFAKDYMRLSNEHFDKAEHLESSLVQDCLK